MVKPNQSVMRFGNRFMSNAYGMRSAPLGKEKAADELRVMVFGDSIVNGGDSVDQADLATTQLQASLNQASNQNVVNQNIVNQNVKSQNAVVGNISSNSWGPGNWLAYAQEYGFFEADTVVLVISSHDYADVPTFEPLEESSFPTQQPISALSEALIRYAPKAFSKITGLGGTASDHLMEITEQNIASAMGDLQQFLQLAKGQSDNVLVFQHWDQFETETNEADPGYQLIQALCEELGITHHSLGPSFRQAIAQGTHPYRDSIHPNELGQKLIGEAILEVLLANDTAAIEESP
ncbi:MAG: hypothetical protein AAGC93_03165 [Cyanobacteria bacterium P01_F01_bin.53]